MTLFSSNSNLHLTEADAPLQATHLGQAHIAGFGPAGKTCRECCHYGDDAADYPDFYEGSKTGGALKPGRCLYPIRGKARRKFPHSAKACRFFEQSDNPPPTAKLRG